MKSVLFRDPLVAAAFAATFCAPAGAEPILHHVHGLVTSDDKARGIVKLKVTSQGCADIGVCYVPLEQFVEARLPGRSSATPGAVRQGGSR